jgi:ATP-dependent helicase/DNAse subunit B
MADIFFGPFTPFLEETFLDRLSRHKGGTPLLPIAVIAPTRAVNKRLGSLLASQGDWVHVHFYTFLTASFALLQQKGVVLPPSPPRAAMRFLLKEILEQAATGDTLARHLLRYDSYLDRLLTLFSHFTSHHVLKSERGVPQTITSLFERFSEAKKSAGFFEAEDIIRLARESMKDGLPPSFPQTLFLYGFYDLNPLQREIVRSLDEKTELIVLSPILPDEPAARYAQETTEFFLELKGEGTATTYDAGDNTHPLFLLPRHFFSPQPADPIDPGDSLRVVTASGSDGEALAVAMEILREKEDTPNLRWREIGVVMRDLPAMAERLDVALKGFTIPAFIDGGSPLMHRREARAYFTLISAIETNLARKTVSTLFSSDSFAWPHVPPTDEEWVRENAHLAEVIAQDRGIISGRTPWERAWNKEEVASDSLFDEGRETDDVRSKSMQSKRRFVSATRKTIIDLVTDLTSIPDRALADQYRDIFLGLLEKYIRPAKESSEPFLTLSGIIDSLARIPCRGKPIPLGDFLALARKECEDTRIPHTPDTDAVFVSDVMGARGLPFRVLILCGMNEKRFPRTGLFDPLVGEDTREHLGLSTRASRYREDRYLFAATVRAARDRLIVVYQKSDDSGRKSLPSTFVGELLKGTTPGEGRSAKPTPKGEVTSGDSRRDYPRFPFQREALSRHREKDFLIRACITAQDPDLVRGVISSSRFLKEGITALAARKMTEPFGAYDGIIGVHDDILAELLPLSAGKLETYARCPFRFFMEHLLSVTPAEEPTEEEDIEAREIGSIYHRVLTSLFGTLAKQGSGGVASETQSMALTLLQKIIRDDVSKRLSGLIPNLVLRAREEKIKESLENFIIHEAGRSKSGFIPTRFEAPFGTGRGKAPRRTHPLTWNMGGETITFSGQIDRIDVHENEKKLLVIDYKKKKPSGQRKLMTEITEGFHFQIPLYLLAAQTVIFSPPYASQGGLLLFIEEEENKMIDAIEGDDTTRAIDLAIEHAEQYIEKMKQGIFYPKAMKGEGSCTFCQYRDLCRTESKGITDIREKKTKEALSLPE